MTNHNAHSAPLPTKDKRVAPPPPPGYDASGKTGRQLTTPEPGDSDEVIAWKGAMRAHIEGDPVDRLRADIHLLERDLERKKLQLLGQIEEMELLHEVRQQRVRESARETVRRERAEAQFSAPTYLPTLADELALPEEKPQPRIAGLCFVENNVLMSAKAKAGKSTTTVNIIRSLADGDPFLGQMPVTVPAGRIGYLNYEMSRAQANEWFRSANIQRPDRVAVQHLRGYRLPLIVPIVQDFLVEWAKACEVEVLIADPWGRMMAGSGSENSNDDVRVVLEILGEIKRRANIADLFVIAHMGHQEFEIGAERARGASELLGWPDVIWTLTRQGDTRFLSAVGRDIDFPEKALTFQPTQRRLIIAAGATDRKSSKQQTHVEEVVQIVTATPGLNTDHVMKKMQTTSNRAERSAAVQAAKKANLIKAESVGRAKPLYPTAPQAAWPNGAI